MTAAAELLEAVAQAKQRGAGLPLQPVLVLHPGDLDAMLKLAVQDEREACAQVAASYRMLGAATIAEAIRGRGE